MQVFEEAIKLHDSVIPLLPSDEQTKQNDWFSSIYKYSDAFVKDTKQWISGIESSSDNAQDQPLESAGCHLDQRSPTTGSRPTTGPWKNSYRVARKFWGKCV